MNSETTLDNAIDRQKQIIDLMWQLHRSWLKAKNQSLEDFGITGSQAEILTSLFRLQKFGKPVTQILISQDSGIDPVTTSTVLRKLVQKGIVERYEHPSDTRAYAIHLTEKGKNLIINALEKIKLQRNALFENIDLEALNAQLSILLNVIEKTINNKQ